MKEKIKALLSNYNPNSILSEMDVRSKLIVPFLEEILGFPTNLRAEEFPVYFWQGSKRTTKYADYILFSNEDYNKNNKFNSSSLCWIHNHSLLIVEAKAPNKIEDYQGQAISYTQTTRALAYIVCDGIRFKGFFNSNSTADIPILDCEIYELVNQPQIEQFTYKNLLSIKEKLIAQNNDIQECLSVSLTSLNKETEMDFLDETEKLDLPYATLKYMSDALGLDINTTSPYSIVKRFLSFTNTILELDLRNNIPSYMFDIPRRIDEKIHVLLDDSIKSLFAAQYTEYYWENKTRIHIQNGFLEIVLLLEDCLPIKCIIKYSVKDLSTKKRLHNLEIVKSCFNANRLVIKFDDGTYNVFELGQSRILNYDSLECLNYWINEIKKAIAIEEYFDIKFSLKHVDDGDETLILYEAVDRVYNGINGLQTCNIIIPSKPLKKSKIKISSPILYENKEFPEGDLSIHGIVFRPHTSMILPGNYKKGGKLKNCFVFNATCSYKVIKHNTK